MKRVVCFGPGPMFKGGISNYNTSLAKSLEKQGAEVHIVSWTQQYPAIIPRDFVDRSSKADLLAGTNIKVTYLTNYNNPLSWNETYDFIVSLKQDVVMFQWAIALQGLPMGHIAKKLSKHKDIDVVFDLHVVKQKEASSLDNSFVKYGLKHAKTFIAHSYQSAEELKNLFPETVFQINESGVRFDNAKTIIKLYHPIYDMFQPDPNFDKEQVKQEMGLKKNVFLFFGFIRKYKGLHNVIPAFAELCKRRDDVSLLIAGESFWQTLDKNKLSTRIKSALFGTAKKLFLKNSDNEQDYNPLALIKELGIEDRVVSFNEFIPNEDVHKYFQVADCIVNYYLTATPSGVESIAYNFHMPILATKVGHFPETVKPGYNGYLAEPENIQSMADTMEHFLNHPIDRKNVEEFASHLSWENYAKAIIQ
jgi:glycosyltransferase involved in cell wall biosynthesis